jgi:hypothetical protein
VVVSSFFTTGADAYSVSNVKVTDNVDGGGLGWVGNLARNFWILAFKVV